MQIPPAEHSLHISKCKQDENNKNHNKNKQHGSLLIFTVEVFFYKMNSIPLHAEHGLMHWNSYGGTESSKKELERAVSHVSQEGACRLQTFLKLDITKYSQTNYWVFSSCSVRDHLKKTSKREGRKWIKIALIFTFCKFVIQCFSFFFQVLEEVHSYVILHNHLIITVIHHLFLTSFTHDTCMFHISNN